MERPQHRNTLRIQPHPARPGVHGSGAHRCRRKFLRFFPRGFYDLEYLDWERNYKWEAHESWLEQLNPAEIERLIRRRDYTEIAARAVRIESRTNLLFSFEKMALRDATRQKAGARIFALALRDFLNGSGPLHTRFESWCEAISRLPRKQTRVLNWPVVTVFGFLAQPEIHFFLKPNVMRMAARLYGLNFEYQSRPSWQTYESLLKAAAVVRNDLRDLRPRDLIDIQSFLWIQGSEEYAE